MQGLNFILDSEKVYFAMKERGYSSIEELANALGVHRNTIFPYLSGDRALPDCLDRLLFMLNLSPREALIPNYRTKKQYGLELSMLLSDLVQANPLCAFFLFGSRARGDFKKYSDYDLGVYSKNGLGFSEFSKLIDLAKKWEEDKHYDVNLTNFTLADAEFIMNVSRDWVFLGGDLASWVDLHKKAGIKLYE